MTPHPHAEYLRALADGKRVMVDFMNCQPRIPFDDCSATVQMSLLYPKAFPQSWRWTFHIEQEQTP